MSQRSRYVVPFAGALLAALVPVLAGGTAQATPPATSAAHAVRPQLAPRTVAVSAPSASPARPALGQRYVVSGRMPGHLRRPVAVIVDGTRRARSHTTRRGHYRFVLRAPAHTTTLRVKVRAPRVRRHRAALSAVRLVPVVLPVQACTKLPAGTTTWKAGSKRTVDCSLTVPVGSTLRIGAGATVLFGEGAGILVKGSLRVVGTADAPVRLRASTSQRWSGVSASGDPSLDLVDFVVSRAERGVDVTGVQAAQSGHLRIAHGTFAQDVQGVVAQDEDDVAVTGSVFRGAQSGAWLEGADHPVVASNLFHAITGTPLTLAQSSIAPNAVHDNAGYANATNVWSISGSIVDVDGTMATGPVEASGPSSTTPMGLTPLLVGSNAGLEVIPGATLTVGPGVVKVGAGSGVFDEGRLVLAGTDTAPVTFTSAADDSLGGKAQATSVAPAPGDWQGLMGGGGEIQAQHAQIRYADAGIFNFISGTTVSISDSALSHTNAGIFGYGSISVTHTSFADGGDGVLLLGGTHPVVSDNSFTNMASSITIGGATIDLDDLHGNTAVDTGGYGLSLAGPETEGAPVEIDADGSWPVGPADWNPTGDRLLGQTVALTPVIEGTVSVDAGATVTMGPGSLKFGGLGTLDVLGSLTIEGTPSAPAVLTSEEDNQVGNPVMGEGIGTAELWGDISWHDGAHVSVSNAVFRGGGLVALGAFDDAQDPVALSNVEFADTTKAIDAAGTSGCGAPYGTASITGDNVWFGASGSPGGLSALSTVTDPGSGDATYAEAKAAYDDAVTHYGSLDSGVTDNTIPFADWTCADFSFPITPALVDVAAAAPFPAYAQTP